MSRIRTIKPDFWSDGDMLKLSRDARLFYIGLWNFLDDNGVMEYDLISIKSKVFPNDKIKVEKLMKELLDIKKIKIYEVLGKTYFQVKSLKSHQIIDRPRKSHLPLPDPCQLKSTEISPIRKEGSKEGKEGNIRKGRIQKQHPRLFSYIYEQYPNKEGKTTALSYFNKYIRTKKDWFAICKALKNYNDMLAIETWRKPQLASVWFNTPEKGKKGGDKGWINFVDYIHPSKQAELDKQEEQKQAEKKYFEKVAQLQQEGKI